METMSRRIVWLRTSLGITQREMAGLVDCNFSRYKNVEHETVRVSEQEIMPLCKTFQNLCHFITFGGKIDLEALELSDEPLEKLLAEKLKAKRVSLEAEDTFFVSK